MARLTHAFLPIHAELSQDKTRENITLSFHSYLCQGFPKGRVAGHPPGKHLEGWGEGRGQQSDPHDCVAALGVQLWRPGCMENLAPPPAGLPKLQNVFKMLSQPISCFALRSGLHGPGMGARTHGLPSLDSVRPSLRLPPASPLGRPCASHTQPVQDQLNLRSWQQCWAAAALSGTQWFLGWRESFIPDQTDDSHGSWTAN